MHLCSIFLSRLDLSYDASKTKHRQREDRPTPSMGTKTTWRTPVWSWRTICRRGGGGRRLPVRPSRAICGHGDGGHWRDLAVPSAGVGAETEGRCAGRYVGVCTWSHCVQSAEARDTWRGSLSSVGTSTSRKRKRKKKKCRQMGPMCQCLIPPF